MKTGFPLFHVNIAHCFISEVKAFSAIIAERSFDARGREPFYTTQYVETHFTANVLLHQTVETETPLNEITGFHFLQEKNETIVEKNWQRKLSHANCPKDTNFIKS